MAVEKEPTPIDLLAERQRRGMTAPKWLDMSAGRPRPSYPNARLAMESFDDIEFSYDLFSDRGHVAGDCIAGGRAPLADAVIADIRQRIVDEFGFDAGKDHCFDAALQLCREAPFDPVVDELARLQNAWDGKERLDTWLVEYLGAEDTALNREFGRKVLLAAVRRARQPGVKFDNILVLEGPQGVGKSSVVRVLAGSDAHFSDQDLLHSGTREHQELLAGVWLFEIGELAGMQRTEVEKIKAFASRTHDRARPAYGRLRIDQPRRCIFIATTNQREFLRDHTGNRRFWPVKVGCIKLDELAADRDQLWAEAAVVETTDESLFLNSARWEEASQAQEARLEVDPWLDELSVFDLPGSRSVHRSDDGSEDRVAFAEVMRVLGIPAERQNQIVQRRVTEVMHRLGWVRASKPFKIEKQATRGYTRAVTDGARCN